MYGGKQAQEVEESIYSLIPRTPPAVFKPRRYKSIHSEKVQKELNLNKNHTKTMGPGRYPPPDTKNFLKKQEKESKKTTVNDLEGDLARKSREMARKPAVPRRDERPVMGSKTEKNFIKSNAIENINANAKKSEPKYVDAPSGSTHPLVPSGLVPKYVVKKEYGKVPGYLEKRKEEQTLAQESYDQFVLEQQKSGALKQLSEKDRQAVIEGLKKNWEDLYKQYQGLSVVTDTAPKKARKERLEADMKRLEKDIEVMEGHTVIYVSASDVE